jgi:release factor glutamine methyltransferase
LHDAVEKLKRAGCPEPRAEAEVLLAHVLREDRMCVVLDRRTPVPPRAAAAFARCVARRERREPVSYITEEREFWSLPLRVTRAVLVPRPDTETLVEEALDLLARIRKHGKPRARVIDVGTGSGCIAVALATERPDIRVWAIDRSARALRIAASNAARHGVAPRVRFVKGDLLSVAGTRIPRADLIVSNPPYVTAAEWKSLPPEIRAFEPKGALVGGADGLAFYRRLAKEAPDRLVAGGCIAVEVGAGHAAAVADLFLSGGRFGEIRVRKDLSGIPRVVSARHTTGS